MLALVENTEPNELSFQQSYVNTKLLRQPNIPAVHRASNVAFEPMDRDVETRLHQYNYKDNSRITIQCSNITTRTTTLQSKTIVCELQYVTSTYTFARQTAYRNSTLIQTRNYQE